ncbi:unnamed protein product (macronuclear) [Paramecium tetraurelia]|uniref:Uncharacterized protein n=1 Tax=Paramecium tetraurelia TaxID=5888 RepID=A0CNW3_PARTE|nr:uncharacterized protein GSPATT00038749001 [Paramecium tetraurelia]CAK72480.1 unnamed protein product [Paramecium tetraurelia]|eukprot:XP_001439877.1 hypothetical protein (macronuclear) [Paramecium tetraurelia strain d4-2]
MRQLNTFILLSNYGFIYFLLNFGGASKQQGSVGEFREINSRILKISSHLNVKRAISHSADNLHQVSKNCLFKLISPKRSKKSYVLQIILSMDQSIIVKIIIYLKQSQLPMLNLSKPDYNKPIFLGQQ